MVSKGTSPYTQRLRTAGEMRCLQSCILQRGTVQHLCMFIRSVQYAAQPRVLLLCMWTHSARRDKWNEVNHLGDCSQAIDFTGHQIMVGLAEYMPFSTSPSLSFSPINSSNYRAPPTEINSETIILSSRNQNEEVQYHRCNHTSCSVVQPFHPTSML